MQCIVFEHCPSTKACDIIHARQPSSSTYLTPEQTPSMYAKTWPNLLLLLLLLLLLCFCHPTPEGMPNMYSSCRVPLAFQAPSYHCPR